MAWMDLVSRADDGMGHSASFAHDHTEAFPLPNLPEEIFFCHSVHLYLT
jgi:hypothetical protein